MWAFKMLLYEARRDLFVRTIAIETSNVSLFLRLLYVYVNRLKPQSQNVARLVISNLECF